MDNTTEIKYELGGPEYFLLLRCSANGVWSYRLSEYPSDVLNPLDAQTQTKALHEAVSCIQDECAELAKLVGRLV